jgi:hypothetical protein
MADLFINSLEEVDVEEGFVVSVEDRGTVYVKVGGVWTLTTTVWVHTGGVWVASTPYTKDEAVWL